MFKFPCRLFPADYCTTEPASAHPSIDYLISRSILFALCIVRHRPCTMFTRYKQLHFSRRSGLTYVYRPYIRVPPNPPSTRHLRHISKTSSHRTENSLDALAVVAFDTCCAEHDTTGLDNRVACLELLAKTPVHDLGQLRRSLKAREERTKQDLQVDTEEPKRDMEGSKPGTESSETGLIAARLRMGELT